VCVQEFDAMPDGSCLGARCSRRVCVCVRVCAYVSVRVRERVCVYVCKNSTRCLMSNGSCVES